MKKIVAANWKCNPTSLTEARKLFNSIKKRIKKAENAEVVICPPFVYLPALPANGAQDCFWEEKGAFTGEVSAKMLKDLGVEYVILGHSERRKYQKETDKTIEKKLEAALRAGLKPILCIDKISQLPKEIKGGFIVAYEPLFAIGTGKACSLQKARKVMLDIKKKIKVPVLYGGSASSKNAADYIEKAGFDGLLVGGASLKAGEFVRIALSLCK